jgi:hypothetical protein
MKIMKNQIKKAYNEIFEMLNVYKDFCIFDIDDLKRKSECHLFGIELKEVYGLDIDPKNIDSLQWLNFGEYRHIGWWGTKYNRTISWPNDSKQPVDELLLEISFPTGPFIFAFGGGFNQEYPQEFFQKFWNELKSYNPDYVDDHNNCLYWKIENANKIFNSFDNILERYYELNKEDNKQRKIKRMKEELSKLENNEAI